MLKKQKSRITRQIYLEWSRKGMSVKLYEIAKACGVSISTVSRVLNNDRQKPASTPDRLGPCIVLATAIIPYSGRRRHCFWYKDADLLV